MWGTLHLYESGFFDVSIWGEGLAKAILGPERTGHSRKRSHGRQHRQFNERLRVNVYTVSGAQSQAYGRVSGGAPAICFTSHVSKLQVETRAAP